MKKIKREIKGKAYPTERDRERFEIPGDIYRRASADTKKGVRIKVSPRELMILMNHADEALNGDSNDAEHDALYDIRQELSEIFEDPDRRSKCPTKS